MSTGRMFRPGSARRRKQSSKGVSHQSIDPRGRQTEDEYRQIELHLRSRRERHASLTTANGAFSRGRQVAADQLVAEPKEALQVSDDRGTVPLTGIRNVFEQSRQELLRVEGFLADEHDHACSIRVQLNVHEGRPDPTRAATRGAIDSGCSESVTCSEAPGRSV